ncbi:MAG: precorrin-3B C(17)-methyltransferase [Firmicutes bacterium]|nr:precorrin-3B C(17)-methyltransferase [Bacillota bacterium]
MGKVTVVGIGPGKFEGMTMEADEAIRKADIIVGYKKYVELVMPHYEGKEFFDNGMRQEEVRCREALKMASEGKDVALVCSGDSCVYGMAGLVYQLAPEFENVEVSAIPGVTAALSGSSVLGAALGHDFAVISLSDLLTPWELIVKRLDACAMADMCIALYNPGSHKRTDYLKKACDVLLRHKAPETVCGTVNNIGREGQCAKTMTLAELRDTPVDMFTTVFIGNSATKIIDGKMVTPRGYRIG